jgi:uncharacterized protein YlxP (DUF503 family)
MHVATCVITLQLFGVDSLKGKRRTLKSLLTRLPRHFSVAVAEVDSHDVWQTSVICLVTVGVDSGQVHSRLERAVSWIESSRPDLVIERYSIEFR